MITAGRRQAIHAGSTGLPPSAVACAPAAAATTAVKEPGWQDALGAARLRALEDDLGVVTRGGPLRLDVPGWLAGGGAGL